MAQLELILPDGTVLSVEAGTTSLQVAAQIGRRLAKDALAASLGGEALDLDRPLDHGGDFRVFTFANPEGKEVLWHSTAHVMAAAVLSLFPGAKPTIGPAIDEGFYYDFDTLAAFSDDELRQIEAKMAEIIAADVAFVREEVPRDEARRLFEAQGNQFKVELIDEIEDDTVSLYRTGDFVDLCRGPHIPSTGRIKAYRLLSVAGAYWRGDEHNLMLKRIYGAAFPTEAEVEAYLAEIEQARLNDHRRIGRDLDLFNFFEEAGAGLVYYPPNGAMLRQIICDFSIREHLKRGYKLVTTPHIVKASVWETSGHIQQGYPMYFTEIDEQRYGIKPMNCPGHILIYKSASRSYRDLPIRYFELGTVYRHERSGVLHGLLRVRGFTQDDAHIFCTMEQLTDELVGVLRFAKFMLGTFGFHDYNLFLSTRPEKSLGSADVWDLAQAALAEAMDKVGLPYKVDPGEGAFYGPKIDVKLQGPPGPLSQGPTIQCDLNLPERFDLSYIGPDGKHHRPAMIHRVVLAGIERFLGAYIEHVGGNFPVWNAPVQAVILPIADRHQDYARHVLDELLTREFRVEVDDSAATLNLKIRNAEMQKLPYMLIVGDREQEAGQVAVRSRDEGDLGPMSLEAFVTRLAGENKPPIPPE